jgi:hypothetical protein
MDRIRKTASNCVTASIRHVDAIDPMNEMAEEPRRTPDARRRKDSQRAAPDPAELYSPCSP